MVAEPGPGVDTRALYDRIREFANDAAREMASKRRVELLEAIGKLRRESQAEIDELLGPVKATTFVDAAEVKPAAHDATRFKRMYDEAVALLDIGYGFASPDWINGYQQFMSGPYRDGNLASAVEEAWRLLVQLDAPMSVAFRERLEEWRKGFFAEFGPEKRAMAEVKVEFHADPKAMASDLAKDVQAAISDGYDKMQARIDAWSATPK